MEVGGYQWIELKELLNDPKFDIAKFLNELSKEDLAKLSTLQGTLESKKDKENKEDKSQATVANNDLDS